MIMMTVICIPIIAFTIVVDSAAVLPKTQVIDRSIEPKETVLNDEDFQNDLYSRHSLAMNGVHVKDDPTIGNYSEGDIYLPNVKEFVDQNNKLGRNAIKQPYRRWPNGVIPYTLSTQYGAYARSVIAKAMDEYHKKTCVKFVARDASKHPDYLWIHPDQGCYSLVGKTGGKQPLSLDSGCIQVGTIVHELMHAVGFFHEQSRQDRDSYIDVVWQNVMKGADDQFEKYNLNVISHLDEPYDYGSIMHYGPYAFSGSGKKTLIPKKNGAERMGQRVKFSDIDVRKINKLYNCQPSSAVTSNAKQIATNSIVPQSRYANLPPSNRAETANNRQLVRIFG